MKTIAIDFDGVVHKYSKGWKDGSVYDVAVEGSIDAIKKLLSKGFNVVIFTARDNLSDVKEWLTDYGLDIEATNKKPKAFVYIDDRAIRFTNWVDVLKYF